MSERLNHNETIQNKPFIIRGHHLAMYAEFMSRNESPSLWAKKCTMVFDQRRKKTKDQSDKNYYYDLLGDSKKDLKKYEKNFKNTFTAFKELDGKTSVVLTSGTPDNICASCTGKGEHCKTRGFGGIDYLYGDFLEVDDIFVDEFLQAAEDSYLFNNVEWKTEKAVFSDAPPVTVNKILMPAGDVKDTLRFILENTENYPNFNDLLYK